LPECYFGRKKCKLSRIQTNWRRNYPNEG
jgi:hypothetical protein